MDRTKEKMSKPVINKARTILLFTQILFIIIFFSPHLSAKKEDKSASYWYDLSRFLAGMPVSADSSFLPLTLGKSYKTHVKRMNGFWEIVENETVNRMVPWQKKNINDKNSISPVFYPLSGADFINPYILFPHSNLYIMAALEEPGVIPVFIGMKRRQINNGLLSLQRAVYLYGKNNYFQSKVMIRELKRYTIKGTTPLILIFMARLGLKPVNVESIFIDEEGHIKRRKSGEEKIKNQGRIIGSLIQFMTPQNRELKTLYYFRVKLEKNTVDPESPPGKFFSKLENINTVIKAGCYIFHLKQFKDVQDYIITRSKIIIQDDSGIPYRSFDRSLWNLKHFGVYIPNYPISDTRVYRQNDLVAIYRKVKNPLPFNFGYGSLLGKNKSNLLLAEKKDRGPSKNSNRNSQ